MAEKAPGGVQSVERVFELLELITDAGGDVTLSELSSSTDLPLPTIHRLLRTLVTLATSASCRTGAMPWARA